MQLCGSLSILWHCLSLGLEWKLTFSSPVATAEFSKFVGILSAAFSQHHLSGFEIVQLEFHHLASLALFIVSWPGIKATSMHWKLKVVTTGPPGKSLRCGSLYGIILKIQLPRWLSGKEFTCQCGRSRFTPWVRKIPWRRKWQPSPVWLPVKSQGQRSLVGYSLWVTKSWLWLSD